MNLPVCEPLIPIALWLSLAVAAVGLLGWYGLDLVARIGSGRGWTLVALMLLVVAAPLAILLNPTWHERLPPPAGKPQLTVLVDASSSMATPDGAGDKRRWDEARREAAAVALRLADRFDVQLRTFASGSQTVESAQLKSVQPSGETTDLAAALEQSLGADKPQGQAIVLLSDGVHNAGGGEAAVMEMVSRAKVLSAPIFTRTFGGAAGVRDLAVEIPSPQDLAFVGQKTPVRVQLVPHGVGGGTTRITLSLDGREVEQREVVLADNRVEEIEFAVEHDESGVFRYQVHAEPIGGEATEANNQATYVLRVVDAPIRVLLLEGKPYWDTKFLMRTLAADPCVEITGVTRLAEGRFLERVLKRPAAKSAAGEEAKPAPAAEDAPPPTVADTPAVPGAPVAAEKDAQRDDSAAPGARPESWKILNSVSAALAGERALENYQIVVLGRDAEVYLTDETLQQLKRWLARDGGSLVCFRGTPTVQVSQRLGSLLPVRANQTRESRFRLKFTEMGRELRWFPTDRDGHDPLSGLPSLATRADAAHIQPLTVVWALGESAAGDAHPAVTSMPYGTGRVVVLEGAGMWRWAFMPPQYQQHEQVYGALWQSLTRWLVSNTGLLPTQTWSLRADKTRFLPQESATASLLVRATALADGPPQVELSGDDFASRRLPLTPVGDEPGVFRVIFGKLPEGRYQSEIVGSLPGDSAARTAFEVRRNVDELIEVAANPRLMARVAEVSGGAVLTSLAPEEIARQLEDHLSRVRPEQVRVTTAWDRWWVLSGAFALWGVVWALRRSQGLV